MGPDEQQETLSDQQAQLAATIAALSLRVEALECELSLRALQQNAGPSHAAAKREAGQGAGH